MTTSTTLMMLAMIVAITTSPARAAPPAAPPPPVPPAVPLRSIAVLDVKTAAPADREVATLFTQALAKAVASATKAKVVTPDEVRALLDVAAAQALMGCEDERCSVDRLTSVLAVDEIIVGRAAAIDGTVLAFVSLVDTRTASVLARASTTFARGVDPAPAAAAAAAGLWGDIAAGSGDRLLAEMRIAPLFDEAIALADSTSAAERPPEKMRAVEMCVLDQLIETGVAIVTPDSVAALKGVQAQILTGELPAFMTSKEVDALLVSRVEYTPGGKFAGAVRADADMSFRLVQVDTGTVVAAKQLRAAGGGFNDNAARKDAARKLCEDVRPLLGLALDARRARGNRVVVDVEGALTVRGQADAVAAELKKYKGVARVTISRFDERSATLDVIVAGGDGVSLGIDLLSTTSATGADKRSTTARAPTTMFRVVSAERSALKLKLQGAR